MPATRGDPARRYASTAWRTSSEGRIPRRLASSSSSSARTAGRRAEITRVPDGLLLISSGSASHSPSSSLCARASSAAVAMSSMSVPLPPCLLRCRRTPPGDRAPSPAYRRVLADEDRVEASPPIWSDHLMRRCTIAPVSAIPRCLTPDRKYIRRSHSVLSQVLYVLV